jgi:3-dehydrosphinganine reductase
MIQLIELMILAGIFSIGCIGCVGYIVYIFWYKKAYDYKDKHVIITGGSSGIGLELAKCFYNAGSKVTIVARTKENLILAQNEITKHGKNQGLSPENLMILPLDVSSNQSNVSSVLNKCTQKFGPCDVLINSAGTSVAGAIQDLKDDEFLRMLQLNVLGSIYPTRAVLAGMRSKQGGRIVFLSSQAGQVGLYGYTAYSTSKYALRGFAETLQMEVRPDNIFVSLAFPPDTRTPGYEQEMLTKVRTHECVQNNYTISKQ